MKAAARVAQMTKSAIHEMTRLSQQLDDVAFLSWAKPTSDTPAHIKEGAIKAIRDGLVGGYSGNAGILPLREEIVKKLKRDNHVDADVSQVMVTAGASGTCTPMRNTSHRSEKRTSRFRSARPWCPNTRPLPRCRAPRIVSRSSGNTISRRATSCASASTAWGPFSLTRNRPARI